MGGGGEGGGGEGGGGEGEGGGGEGGGGEGGGIEGAGLALPSKTQKGQSHRALLQVLKFQSLGLVPAGIVAVLRQRFWLAMAPVVGIVTPHVPGVVPAGFHTYDPPAVGKSPPMPSAVGYQ